MKKYTVKVRYTFVGTVTVQADSKKEAKEVVARDFGPVLGPVSCTNDEQVKDWDLNTHADFIKIV